MTDIPTQSGPPALGDRLVTAVIGAYEAAAVDLGDRLGWYRALAGSPATAAELAERTDTHPRYAREWLEQQAVAGYLAVDDVATPADERRYTLPDEHRAVLVDDDDPGYATPLARLAMTFTRNVPRLAEVYRSGGGLSWAEMGPEAREGQAAANRPFFVGPLVDEVFPALPEVDAVLRAGGRVADIGCGLGWSSIGMASGYPSARVDGVDVDVPSLEQARRNAAAAGVAERVRFTVADAGGLAAAGEYDLVTAFECVHDLPDPVAVLSTMRGPGAAGGASCWWWTRRSRRASPRPATRWNASCTATASPAACRMRCPCSRRRRPARSCGPRRWPGTPGRPASPAWRCWRSTTTSSGSTD